MMSPKPTTQVHESAHLHQPTRVVGIPRDFASWAAPAQPSKAVPAACAITRFEIEDHAPFSKLEFDGAARSLAALLTR